MEAALSFVLWLGLIVASVQLGRYIRVALDQHIRQFWHIDGDSSRGRDLRWVQPEQDLDPVCHKTVRTVNAKPSVYDGLVYYFCSRECREAFEAAPELHLPPHDGG